MNYLIPPVNVADVEIATSVQAVKPYGYIYCTTNEVNGKVYIGLSSGEFDRNYLGSGVLLVKAVKKYTRKSFSVMPIVYVDTIEELNKTEKKLIARYRFALGFDNVYNIDEGGYHDGFAGSKRSRETSEKCRLGNLGKHVSIESRKKMSIAKKGKPSWNKGTDLSGMKGKKHSQSTIDKMKYARSKKKSPGMTGKFQSVETVEQKTLTREQNSIRKLWADCILGMVQ